ncbi:hypothetical protein BJ138DRAFT_1140664 [Hygrophoropsis aurantiaca]|uniref:Uncharacterized protein n=1 Tax=Hygrophoropsis aurantiaca TaxID=72124 RepID=A0ACB8ARN7_9AGAM|nr:hypothetical protein BJ138DRAFT_1140664 [Hygrophoropsis aurantiaca]
MPSDTSSLALVNGPSEIGAIISSFLTGCLAVQTYVYYTRFSSDCTLLKIFIAGVCVTEIAHLCCVIVVLWQSTITVLGPTVPSYAADTVIALTIIVSYGGQLFFIFRLLRLSGNKLLPLLCLSLSILFAACGIVISVNAFRMASAVQFVDSQFVVITLDFVAAAACDVATTLGLIYHLRRLRKTEFPNSSPVIDTLILWTMETGLTTSLCTILAALCFVLMRDNFVWMGVYEVLASVRANALLAALNSRSTIRSKIAVATVAGRALEPNSKTREHHDGAQFPKRPSIIVNITRSGGPVMADTTSNEDKGADAGQIQESPTPRFYDASLSV